MSFPMRGIFNRNAYIGILQMSREADDLMENEKNRYMEPELEIIDMGDNLELITASAEKPWETDDDNFLS